MTKLYKLTSSANTTVGNAIKGRPVLFWGENVTHTALGLGSEMCTDGVIHAYLHPLLAIILNGVHGNYNDPKLWIAEGMVVVNDFNTKVGVKTLTTLSEIPLPTITVRNVMRMITELVDLGGGSNPGNFQSLALLRAAGELQRKFALENHLFAVNNTSAITECCNYLRYSLVRFLENLRMTNINTQNTLYICDKYMDAKEALRVWENV